jgi:hypothetical protein
MRPLLYRRLRSSRLVVSNYRSSIPSFGQGLGHPASSAVLHQSDLLGTLHVVIDILEKFFRVSGIKLDRERKQLSAKVVEGT